eukprot:16276982-Heterocapsa_arctica.AAC.1
MLVRTAGLCGIAMSPKKRQRFSLMQNFLGHLKDMVPVRAEGAFVFAPKLGTRDKAIDMIQETLERSTLTP